MVLLFWLSAAFVAYVYVGYPVLLYLWASALGRAKSRQTSARETEVAAPQPISIVIAARNEGGRLPKRIENLLQQMYPAAIQIIVASDGSTDDTVEALRQYGPAVETIALPARGKAAALNAAVARARHDIVVFTDARQTFEPNALRELTAVFDDADVGAVTGELILDCEHEERRSRERRRANRSAEASPSMPDRSAEALRSIVERRTRADRRSAASTIADGIGLYWRYEKSLRKLESAVGSTLGATGAIYAMRRTLWQPLPVDTILDDVLAPMRCVLAGYRVVFNERAQACDRASLDADTEARRKSRTLAGNWQILALEPALLLPWRNPVWLQYVSHKVGRLLVPYALLTLMTASIALAGGSLIYAIALGLQCAVYLLAGYGAWLDFRGRLQTSKTAPVFNVSGVGNA